MPGYLPLTGITMCDPAGIGPEIIAKALSVPGSHKICRPIVVGKVRSLKGGIDILDSCETRELYLAETVIEIQLKKLLLILID